jgi:hypothetical protein
MTRVAIHKDFYFKNFLEIFDWIEKNCKGKVDTSPYTGEDIILYSFKYRIDAVAFSLKYRYVS